MQPGDMFLGLNDSVRQAGSLRNRRQPPETHIKLNSHEISSVDIQNDCLTDRYVMEQRDLTKFGFKMSFWRINYIAQPAWF